jgi:hypothetical protein
LLAILAGHACLAQDGYGVVSDSRSQRWPLDLAVDDATGRASFAWRGDQCRGWKTGKPHHHPAPMHGIAIAPEMRTGFISCTDDSSVVIFDLDNVSVLAHVKVNGASPDAIIYDPFSHDVVVFNGHSSNATVIDAKSNSIVTDIALPGKPELAVSDAEGHVYVNLEDKSMVCVVRPRESGWLAACTRRSQRPGPDNATHRLFSNCDNKLMVVMDERRRSPRCRPVTMWTGLRPRHQARIRANGEGT